MKKSHLLWGDFSFNPNRSLEIWDYSIPHNIFFSLQLAPMKTGSNYEA